MSHLFDELNDDHISFIQAQKIFFVATAPISGRINLSPKGYDSLRIINKNKLVWLNLTGSGNETATHLQEDPRMTVMFCSFEERPITLRVYAQAKVIHQGDLDWHKYIGFFSESLAGKRQIMVLDIDSVQTSCGLSIPFFEYKGEREQLNNWAEKKGKTELRKYWVKKNQFSIDGKPTKIIEQSGDDG